MTGIGGMDVPRWSQVVRTVAPRPLIDAAKEGVRAYGSATARRRVGPDYHIIGAKKSGTTSLANWLGLHQGVARLFPEFGSAKSARFFDTPRYRRGERWYRSHFPTRSAVGRRAAQLGYRPLVGESSPYLLAHPVGPQRVLSYTPDVKLIAILRDPVWRAYSHFRDQVALGWESHSRFEDALRAESTRLADMDPQRYANSDYTHFAHEHFGYVDAGHYADQLRRWLEVFPIEQMLVIRFEDMQSKPAKVFSRVTAFLGLPEATDIELAPRNQRALDQPMAPATQECLRAYFAPLNEDLAQLIGTTPWWE